MRFLGLKTAIIVLGTGAVLAGTPITLRNLDTGSIFSAASSSSGNYTLSQLPAGTYEMSVVVPGFKRYVRQNITVQVAATLRVDITLEVGSAAESVTVNEAAPLLKTESGELGHNVTGDTLNNLPILGIGTASVGSTGIRSVLMPGQPAKAKRSTSLSLSSAASLTAVMAMVTF